VPYLRWRTALPRLRCRVQPLGSGRHGFLVFRVRRRGAMRQLSLLHAVTSLPANEIRRAIRSLVAETGCDVALAAGGDGSLRLGMVPLPVGPRLTWRPLSNPEVPELSDLHLPLGSLELF